MSEKAKTEPKLHGVTAEFDSVDSLMAACERIRDAGYKLTDAYTPFPVHGIDKALGIKPTALPWITFAGGLTGCLIGLFMQVWMNAIDYPYIISGKPYISLPAFIPVTFELTILLASFGSFLGMLALNKLPKFSNPVFTNPRFDRATDDRFFLYIDAKDARFELEGVRRLLSDCSPLEVENVVEDDTPTAMPRFIMPTLGVLALLALLPPLIIARMRVTNSDSPRFHVMFDMDFAPSKRAQEVTTLFADGRAMRPDVPGTVSRGQLGYDVNFQTGIDFEVLAKLDPDRAARLVTLPQQSDDPPASDENTAAATDQAEEPQAADSDESPAEPDAAQTDSDPSEAQPEEADEPDADSDDASAEPADAQSATQDPASPDLEPQAADAAVETVDNTPWLEEIPVPVDRAFLEKGREQYDVYCVVCHGVGGLGNGLVNRRAQRILSQWWIPPSSLHDSTLYRENYPDGKLFSTITHGIRKMPGYGSQIQARDRWAIVAYVRALQKSRNAEMDDIPADRREGLAEKQASVRAALERAEREQAAEQAQAQQEEAQAQQETTQTRTGD